MYLAKQLSRVLSSALQLPPAASAAVQALHRHRQQPPPPQLCRFVSKQIPSSQQHQLAQSEEDSAGSSGDGSSQDQDGQDRRRAPREEKPKTVQQELEDNFAPYRYIYPEFLPHPDLEYRNRIREKLERGDMLARRSVIDIPEFYPGTIMKVGVSDKYAVGKINEFVGICISRFGNGLRASFILRNVVDNQGVEIKYDMYNPLIQYIQVLKLERRLDDNLMFLRDCPKEYSTFPFDMLAELRNPEDPVPINPLVLKINPRPWSANWHTWDLKGVELDSILTQLSERRIRRFNTYRKRTGRDHEVDKYDLVAQYRSTIPMEEQTEIYGEVQPQLAKLSHALRKQKRKRSFVKPQKTG